MTTVLFIIRAHHWYTFVVTKLFLLAPFFQTENPKPLPCATNFNFLIQKQTFLFDLGSVRMMLYHVR